jgi:4-alpha-glucanotransferase
MSPVKKQPSERVGTIVTVSSNISGGSCRVCGEGLGTDDDHIERTVNHYLGHPGTTLLHVGQETTHGSDGQPWHMTVAVIGLQGNVARAAPHKVNFHITRGAK